MATIIAISNIPEHSGHLWQGSDAVNTFDWSFGSLEVFVSHVDAAPATPSGCSYPVKARTLVCTRDGLFADDLGLSLEPVL
jgi:hypothetical protein